MAAPTRSPFSKAKQIAGRIIAMAVSLQTSLQILEYQCLSTVIKMNRQYFCFNFWKISIENIAFLENKKFKKGRFEPSELILYLTFFPPPNHDGRHYVHSIIYNPGILNCVTFKERVFDFYSKHQEVLKFVLIFVLSQLTM